MREADVEVDNLNILIVTHGLTLRLLLMRYFQLSVEEFEQSYNSQNAKLVVMDRMVDEHGKEFFRLDNVAKEALNLRGDVSSQKPVYWRGDSLISAPYDLEE
jgi:broad specificity phosphatase PhoE